MMSSDEALVDRENKVGGKKHYSVTTDESRRKFIELWNSGTITIKQVSLF